MRPMSVLAVARAFGSVMLVSLLVSRVNAMSVSPIHIEMASIGSTARSQVAVTNSGPVPMPVDTAIKRIEVDANGNTKSLDAGEDFLIIPPQAMIPPGSTQVFRVQPRSQ
jgi:fimbrial chaperone protein